MKRIKCLVTEGKHTGLFMVSDPKNIFLGQTHKGNGKIPCACVNDWYKVERWLSEGKADKIEVSLVD